MPFCQLGEGTHQICVTDANGCEVCENITVVACDLTISTGVLDETCAGYCDGSAEAFVTGASGSETYNWTDSQGNYIDNTSIVSGLCPGDYIVDVIDVPVWWGVVAGSMSTEIQCVNMPPLGQ